MDVNDVGKALYSIKSNAIGADGLPLNFIIFEPIKTTLVTLFNNIIATGIFPNPWKDAIVCPIPKIQNPAGIYDFRPIVFITKHIVFSKFQPAYRHFHSTTSAALVVTTDIEIALEKKLSTILIILDFSKAFDIISHDILCCKLIHNLNFFFFILEIIHKTTSRVYH